MTDEAEKKEALPEVPVARFVSPKEREKMVPLDWPVEVNGVLYTEIKVRRVTGKEVTDYFERMGNEKHFIMPPVIDCPMEVWNALDADDQDTIDEAATPFLPRRLAALVRSDQEPGEASSASSQTPSQPQSQPS